MVQLSHPFSQASLVAQLVKNLPAMRETWVRSLGWEDPLEKGKATTPVLPVAFAIACLFQTAIPLLVPNKLTFFKKKKVFLVWTIFQVFIEFVIILLQLHILVFKPRDRGWGGGLNSPAKD